MDRHFSLDVIHFQVQLLYCYVGFVTRRFKPKKKHKPLVFAVAPLLLLQFPRYYFVPRLNYLLIMRRGSCLSSARLVFVHLSAAYEHSQLQ